MATLFWNVFSGKWDDGSSWLGGVAPGPGDTAVVAHGTLTNSTPDLSGLTIVGQAIDVVAANQLVFQGTTLDAASSLSFSNSPGGPAVTLSAAGGNAILGGLMAEGPVDLYLIPGTGASLTLGGTATATGTLRVLGMGTLANAGTLTIGNLADGSSPTVVTVMGAATLDNSGTVDIIGDGAYGVGNVSVTLGDVTGGGVIRAGHGTVSFAGAVSGGVLEFTAATTVVRLDLDTHGFGAVIRGFQPGNSIALGTTAADSFTYTPDPGGNSGVLWITNGGTEVATLAFEGAYHGVGFNLDPDGGSDLLLTTTTVPCFAQGTRLTTRRGEVAVEALAVGDVLPTRLGGAEARVVWIGHRRVACGRHPRPQDVLPVRVRAGAFGEGVPRRDVVLSPDHAVFVDGVLIPVRYLLNDATIVQEAAQEITYWHVELERHDVIEAAGLAVESYLDTGNRDSFANGGATRLFAAFAADGAGEVWRRLGCAPLCLSGAAVEAVQLRLLARARAMGWRMRRAADLRLYADGRRVWPAMAGRQWLVALPRGARSLRLLSGAGVPERLRPGSGDGRRLGVAIAEPVWNGRAAPLEHPRYRGGWHAAEDGWRWTDGAAELDVRGLGDVGFVLRAGEAHWRAPAGRRVTAAG